MSRREERAAWIRKSLLRGREGRNAVNRHVMLTFREGLLAYYRRTPFRTLGDGEEVVAGFFADRLGRIDYFDQWSRSGKKLTQWIINSFRFYLQELCRQSRRDRRYVDLPDRVADGRAEPAELVDATDAWSTVKQALRLTRQECRERKLVLHWHIFELHELHDLPYAEIARHLDVEPIRAASMARSIRLRLKATLRKLVRKNRAREGDVDREILRLIETLAHASEARESA